MNRYTLRPRTLVTGGACFLGSHLCERLLADGHDVIRLDNFFTESKDKILHLLDNPYFELLRHDVIFPLYVEVDEIYDLACPASPIHYQHDPVQTTKTSVHGAIKMLGLAKRAKARIFEAFSSEVYRDPDVHPQPESYWGEANPLGPRSCYDDGKRCAETLFFDYRRQHGMDIKVARIFSTYEPRTWNPTDAKRCTAVRATLKQIDWPCDVHRNYAEINLGLKLRVSSRLDWVFVLEPLHNVHEFIDGITLCK